MFLETISWLDNDVLIPINRIKYVTVSFTDGWVIKIITDDGEWMECFGKDGDKCQKRYKQIKEFLGAK